MSSTTIQSSVQPQDAPSWSTGKQYDMYSVGTYLTYKGYTFTIENKNGQHLNLFLNSEPSLEQLREYIKENYGVDKIMKAPQQSLPSYFTREEDEVEVKEPPLQGPPIQFVKREPKELSLFPVLPKMNEEEQKMMDNNSHVAEELAF